MGRSSPRERSNPEIVSTRLFDAPRELLFAAFTDAATLSKWWGPKGFANTFEEFDPRPGGSWRFVMRDPGGAAFAIEKRFVEVVPHERIVLDHLDADHGFRMLMTFIDEAGRTRLTWRMRFERAEEAERVRSAVVDANEQNFDRLEAALQRRD